MHVFLQGVRNVGKSTVIRETLNLMSAKGALVLGGFFTWNGGVDDPHIYLRPAGRGRENEVYRIADVDMTKRGPPICNIHVFEQEGTRLLEESAGADLIIMDELGFLESNAPKFKKAVLDAIAGDIPVFGVMRLGGIPWHSEIKSNPLVTLYDVNEHNRDAMPQIMADIICRSVLAASAKRLGYKTGV